MENKNEKFGVWKKGCIGIDGVCGEFNFTISDRSRAIHIYNAETHQGIEIVFELNTIRVNTQENVHLLIGGTKHSIHKHTFKKHHYPDTPDFVSMEIKKVGGEQSPSPKGVV